MSSILTNNSAMVALQTLKSINMNLGKVQSEISTGKTVESAKDNAAVWAISKVMSSDVEGFKAISDSLALGQATVGVALNGAETITDLLTEIKGKIVNAQEENVDRAKIQTDIEALTSQIDSIVGAAQFNGLNLLNDDGKATEDQTSNILSSLDRAGDGTVTSGEIVIARSNLSAEKASLAGDAAQVAGGANGGAAIVAAAATTATNVTVVAQDGTATGTDVTGVGYNLVISAAAGTYDGLATTAADDILYVAQEGDTAEDIGAGLKAAFDVWVAEKGEFDADISLASNATGFAFTAGDYVGGTNTISFTVNVQTSATDGNERAGALQSLSAIDVSTENGAADALAKVESLIQTSIDTAAALGSGGRQIDTQSEFVGKLTDLLTSGIGALVDADMEAASAKLQALQTQQQLGVQALSIANQAPQTILSLFR
ncbi:flagellin [Roseobacter ponti]|uniref:Flagellin n=1 Tax=Roseobacter ponti TaxID=1891787 RepID=A0A858SZR4_9RHOB|nr:flagellin [Roseobacter ponti]QJF52991.1 flagellin [Roseobacter ponti]